MNLLWEAQLSIILCPAAAPPKLPAAPHKTNGSLSLPQVLCLNAASLLWMNIANVSNAFELETNPPVCKALYVYIYFLVWALAADFQM